MGVVIDGVMPEHRWIWQGRLLRVVDGDTLDVELDAGFHATRTERLRLYGINTPEIVGASRVDGLASKAWVRQWMDENSAADPGVWRLTIETFKTDVFGRYLAVVWSTWSGECLNDALLLAGMAVPYLPH